MVGPHAEKAQPVAGEEAASGMAVWCQAETCILSVPYVCLSLCLALSLGLCLSHSLYHEDKTLVHASCSVAVCGFSILLVQNGSIRVVRLEMFILW